MLHIKPSIIREGSLGCKERYKPFRKGEVPEHVKEEAKEVVAEENLFK